MREILFRGKDLYSGAWRIGYLTCGNDCMGRTWFIDCPAKDPDDLDHRYYVDPETVGQFTGLTDKNGKKIFEGDVIKQRAPFAEPYRVYFEYGAFRIEDKWGNRIHTCQSSVKRLECEVIGNKYDNPELLEGGAE